MTISIEWCLRRLCLRILDVNGDGSETLDDVFGKCNELFNNLQVDIPETCIDRAHSIGKETPDSIRPIICRFATRRYHTMVYHKWKDCLNCRITLDRAKTRMDILKKAINLAWESDQISYTFTDINCSLCVKLTNGSFKFFDTMIHLSNL